MPRFDDALFDVAGDLLQPRAGRPGKLPSARIRRSISTSYYALFHFLIEEASGRLLGTGRAMREQRHILGRSFTHRGLKTTFAKIEGRRVDQSIEDFLNGRRTGSASLVAPRFARDLADVFAHAQTKRIDADYNLNEEFSASDATLLQVRVRNAIAGWRKATDPGDRDFKHALCVLMLLRGQLRRDD